MTAFPIRTVGLIDIEAPQQAASHTHQPSPLADLLEPPIFDGDDSPVWCATVPADTKRLAAELCREVEMFRQHNAIV